MIAGGFQHWIVHKALLLLGLHRDGEGRRGAAGLAEEVLLPVTCSYHQAGQGRQARF